MIVNAAWQFDDEGARRVSAVVCAAANQNAAKPTYVPQKVVLGERPG